MLKLADNPAILYPENSVIEEMPGRWWVARTKSRHEKALAQWLRRWEIGYFLPLREKLHRGKGRSYKCLVPLFGGYVFFCGDDKKRYTALMSNRIAQVIDVVDQAGLVGELSQLHEAISRGAALDPHPYLQAGDRCQVTSGPLRGLEGIVVRRSGVTRLVLQVGMLGQAAAVEVEAEAIEPIL